MLLTDGGIMSENLERLNVGVNFEGLVRLLAEHLYSEPDVFIRELIQNAHDAIQSRNIVEQSDIVGRIDIKIDEENQRIIIIDNGLGMDRSDIRDLLSTIGNSGKSSVKLQGHDQETTLQLIGQFGIGLLSAFVVGKKVVVRTRKVGMDEAYAWHNEASLDCILYKDNYSENGTEVSIFIRDDYTFMLSEERIANIVRKYCSFIPFPIYLNNAGPINEINAPFYQKHWATKEEQQLKFDMFVARRYSDDMYLDVIPIDIKGQYQAAGVLFITSKRTPDLETGGGTLDIFIRRMFIKSAENNLLPEWAKFVRGVIDSPDLQPTAARDNIKHEHSSFEYIRKALGDAIIERLLHLATHNRQKFREINYWHHYHLKGMACIHQDFFKRMSDSLIMETNKGHITMSEYLTKNSPRLDYNRRIPIYYFPYRGSSAQFYDLANARGWTVINAGGYFDEDFLRKYADSSSDKCELIDISQLDDPHIFERLTHDEQQPYRQFEDIFEGHLKRIGVQDIIVRMRRFEPYNLPAILLGNTESDEELDDYIDNVPEIFLKEVALEIAKHKSKRKIFLNLNSGNKIIKKLSTMEINDELVQSLMTGIYNCAVLYSQRFLNDKNAKAIQKQFVGLFEELIKVHENYTASQTKLEQSRENTINLQEQFSKLESPKPPHILIFMITPFSEEYIKVELAVRHVFELPPYFFEVRLARDYTHSSGLLDNVRKHMSRAHGFIAEVSDLNANVMFELGAAMIFGDQRPVFTLRNEDAKPIPADFRENLYVPYGSLTDSGEEIEKRIRSSFERDGRPTHDGILSLIKQRRQRFLSRTILENLHVKLDDQSIGSLLGNYKTIEMLIDSDRKHIEKKAKLPSFIVTAMIGELTTLLEH